MLVIIECDPKWCMDRKCWRLHLKYFDNAIQKRTYLSLSLSKNFKDASKARTRAKAFMRGEDPLWHDFLDRRGHGRPSLQRRKDASPVTVDWLLQACLKHDEIWGRVARPANYRSDAAKISRICGSWPVANFGTTRALEHINRALKALRDEKLADATIRKLMGMLRQALRAAMGDGISSPILDPHTGRKMLHALPAFPRIPKGKSKETVVNAQQEKMIFSLLHELEAEAKAEEDAFAAKLASQTSDRQRQRLIHGWSRWRRFSSQQWRWYARLTTLLLETGMRRGEALYAGTHTLASIDELDGGKVIAHVPVLHIPGLVAKSSRPRDVNLSQTIRDMIPAMEAEAGPIKRVYKRQSIRIERAWCPLTEGQCTQMWLRIRTLAKECGFDLSKVVLHTLRHTNATRLRYAGMPIDTLKDHLGHANIATTLIYEHVGNQKTAQAARFFKGKSVRFSENGSGPLPSLMHS